jgi:hypothetical protein
LLLLISWFVLAEGTWGPGSKSMTLQATTDNLVRARTDRLSLHFQASSHSNTVAARKQLFGRARPLNRSFSRSSLELCKHRALQSPFGPSSPFGCRRLVFSQLFQQVRPPPAAQGHLFMQADTQRSGLVAGMLSFAAAGVAAAGAAAIALTGRAETRQDDSRRRGSAVDL